MATLAPRNDPASAWIPSGKLWIACVLSAGLVAIEVAILIVRSAGLESASFFGISIPAFLLVVSGWGAWAAQSHPLIRIEGDEIVWRTPFSIARCSVAISQVERSTLDSGRLLLTVSGGRSQKVDLRMLQRDRREKICAEIAQRVSG